MDNVIDKQAVMERYFSPWPNETLKEEFGLFIDRLIKAGIYIEDPRDVFNDIIVGSGLTCVRLYGTRCAEKSRTYASTTKTGMLVEEELLANAGRLL